MNILLAGGAGYIGSHACERLLERGDRVVVYDNLSTGSRAALLPAAKFVFGDIRNTELLSRVIQDEKIDAIIHFAAKLIVSESISVPWEYYDTNVIGGLCLLKAARAAGVNKMIFSSTAAVYGESDLAVDETAPPNPITPYGASKLMFERILQNVGATDREFRWITLRYFNVAGAALSGVNGQRSKDAVHLIKVAAEAAAGKRNEVRIFGTDYATPDGTCIRDYIHVEDLVEAHVMALEGLGEDTVTNQIYNCGYGRGVSVREVLSAMQRVSGRAFLVVEAPRREGDPVLIVADPAKIRSAFGWIPKFESLSVICKTAYDWEVRQKELA